MQRSVDLVAPIFIFFMLLFAYTKLAGPIPFSVNSVTTTKSDAFQVTGEGKVTATPDLAVVNAGVTANGVTVKAAQDQLNGNINKVSAAIKALGVDPKDIQTSNYNINPTVDFTGNQKITGYTANSNLTIKIRNIEKINQVIDAATASGANQVGGVSFEVSDKTKAENEARQKAVADAKKKAENAAKIAGFRLGQLVNYQENFEGQPIPMPLRAAQGSADTVSPPTQVEPGTNEIRVTVTLSYEIR